MKVLLDTHVLLWAAKTPDKLPDEVRGLIEHPATESFFSVASLWEIVIKNRLKRADFNVDPHLLRRGLLENDYEELAISGAHALALELLPPIHKDPFDRILVAQAQVEGITLLTADEILGRYPGPVRVI